MRRAILKRQQGSSCTTSVALLIGCAAIPVQQPESRREMGFAATKFGRLAPICARLGQILPASLTLKPVDFRVFHVVAVVFCDFRRILKILLVWFPFPVIIGGDGDGECVHSSLLPILFSRHDLLLTTQRKPHSLKAYSSGGRLLCFLFAPETN